MSETQNIVDIPLMICIFQGKPDDAQVPYKIFNLKLDEKFVSAAGLVDITSFVTESFEAFKKDNPNDNVRLLMATDTTQWKENMLKGMPQ
jgi:hypothetical protein